MANFIKFWATWKITMKSSLWAGLHRPFQLLQPWGVTLYRLIKTFGRPSCVQNNCFETRSAMFFQGFLAQCYPTVGAGYCTLSSSFVFLRFWFGGDTAPAPQGWGQCMGKLTWSYLPPLHQFSFLLHCSLGDWAACWPIPSQVGSYR